VGFAVDLIFVATVPGVLFALTFYEQGELGRMREVAHATTRRLGLSARSS